MSLISDFDDLRRAFDSVGRKANRQQLAYYKLICGMVNLHQEQRIARNFAVSDALRSILNDVGIRIIQGTAPYQYGEIPEQLQCRQVDDTWQETGR